MGNSTVLDYRLTQDQINEGIKICSDKIKSLLNHAEILLDKISNSDVALGLHTIAIEELGKLLLLKDVLSSKQNSDGTYNVNQKIFHGKQAHDLKFNRILSIIPDNCKKVGNVIGGVPITRHVRAGEVIIPINAGIIPIFNYNLTDFQMRLDVFYIDWDDSNKKWRIDIGIDPAHIRTAINELKNWINQNISV